MINQETQNAWNTHGEWFEYYAYEYPNEWLSLCMAYFTNEHSADECAKIDWSWIKGQLRTQLDLDDDDGDDIYPADPYYRAFYEIEG